MIRRRSSRPSVRSPHAAFGPGRARQARRRAIGRGLLPIPLVAQMVTEALDRPTLIHAHPKYAVALGAARLGAELAPGTAEGSRTSGTAPPGGYRGQGRGRRRDRRARRSRCGRPGPGRPKGRG